MEPNLIGSIINGYQILDIIGRGGMGIVYKALDLGLDRLAAVKMMDREIAGCEEFRKRFHIEAKAQARVKHPNIVDVYAFHESDAGFCIMMEYCEGRTLADLLQSEYQLDVTRSVRLIDQVASALEHAHAAGVIHRDVKPVNIMVLHDDRVKVMDFGLAKLRNLSPMTLTGTTVGSPSYMSPEQVKGEESDHRADIWAVGVVLYEMLTGKLPFQGEYLAAVSFLIVNTNHLPVRQHEPLVPRELEACIDRCLQKDPAFRYQTITEFRRDLSRFLSPRDDKRLPITTRRRRLSTKLLVLAPIIVLAGTVFYALFFVPKTTISVESNPPGASVSLDNVDIGNTPIISRELVPGPVRIQVKCQSYVNRESLVVVAKGSSMTFSFLLQKESQSESSGDLSREAQPQDIDTADKRLSLTSRTSIVTMTPNDRRIPAGVKPPLGKLSIELGTNKGRDRVVFIEGDTMRFFARVNRAAFIRVIYRVADGKRILLTGPSDRYLSEENAGTTILIGEFVCSPPFGPELVQGYAGEEAFEVTRSSVTDGLCYLHQDVDESLSLSRGIQKLPPAEVRAEARIPLTTAPRGSSGKVSAH